MKLKILYHRNHAALSHCYVITATSMSWSFYIIDKQEYIFVFKEPVYTFVGSNSAIFVSAPPFPLSTGINF